MPDQPPLELVATLERLGLASADQVARMGRHVNRLARDLPRFDSVWIDALAQARVLTPFQAAELNAGRANSLRLGPFLLCERLAHPCYVACYRAKNVATGETVRLAVVENAAAQADAILQHLKSRLKQATAVGRDADRLFIAEPWIQGRSAAEWMVHHGRFPPEVVLEIARAMLVQLVELEKRRQCHGDVSTSSLMLTDSGDVILALPGLRGILRPEEGYAHADLLPEAFDSLAPERITCGTPPNTPTDIYSCGCVWWHLLCGRPPLTGGDSLTKLRSAQAGAICDVRRYAPDVPPSLAAAIAACVELEPSRRPESMARLAATLGTPTSNGKAALADCLGRTGRPTVHWTTTTRSIRHSSRTPLWLAGAACSLAVLVAMLWPIWHGRGPIAPATSEVAGTQSVLPQKPCGTTSGSQPTSLAQESPPPSRDNENPVIPTSFEQPTQPPDIVLASDKPTTAKSLDLRAGQFVHPASGYRAVLLVPHAGLVIDKEDVRFENIDFRWDHAPPKDIRTRSLAIVQLLAGHAEFRNCSFQSVQEADSNGQNNFAERSISPSLPPNSAPLPVGIRWIHPAKADQSETSLPSGQIRLIDCLFVGVNAGIDCRTIGALTVELTNSLHLGPGPLVRLDHCPQSDEPVSLSLSQVTLRGTGPLLDCLAQRTEQQPGDITVAATACVFAPRPDEPLVCYRGTALPERLPRGLRWTGQGSLVTPNVPILAWQGPEDRPQLVDESSLSIAGLVRSDVEFAHEPSADPAASRVIRWQAPLRSTNPPGVDPAPLPFSSR